MSPETFALQYRQKLHAIQSAVAFEIGRKGAKEAAADSKHLRTGLNTVMADVGSLLRLLVKKGVITEEEMQEAILDGLDQEIARYKAIFERDFPGANINFA